MHLEKEIYQAGFTLVELMVASLILGMAITAVMTMLTIGRTIEAGDCLRRQARILAASILEDSLYQSDSTAIIGSNTVISTLTPGIGLPIPDTLTVNVVKVAPVSWTDGNDATLTILVPFKTVTVNISWSNAGVNETISLQKSIPEEL